MASADPLLPPDGDAGAELLDLLAAAILHRLDTALAERGVEPVEDRCGKEVEQLGAGVAVGWQQRVGASHRVYGSVTPSREIPSLRLWIPQPVRGPVG